MKIIRVKVKPNARTSDLQALPDCSYLARLKSSPVDGKADGELVKLIAEHFGRHKAKVSVKSGAASRVKLVQRED